MDAAKQFVLRFNAHDLSGVAGLFAVDARTYWARRGEPVTNGFKEGGREMIRAMLEARMSDGEILAFDRIDPDPSPAIMYADGAGHFAQSPELLLSAEPSPMAQLELWARSSSTTAHRAGSFSFSSSPAANPVSHCLRPQIRATPRVTPVERLRHPTSTAEPDGPTSRLAGLAGP